MTPVYIVRSERLRYVYRAAELRRDEPPRASWWERLKGWWKR